MATCCAVPARTSTTPSSRRRSCGSATRSTCCARRRRPASWASSTRSAGGRDGQLWVEQVRRPPHSGRCTVYRPDIGGLLPVYVYDDYEGFEVKTFDKLSDAELSRYIEANVAAVRDVVEAADIEAGFANHLLMGPAVLARGWATARTRSRSTARRWSTR